MLLHAGIFPVMIPLTAPLLQDMKQCCILPKYEERVNFVLDKAQDKHYNIYVQPYGPMSGLLAIDHGAFLRLMPVMFFDVTPVIGVLMPGES